jgi:hypothetical protein
MVILLVAGCGSGTKSGDSRHAGRSALLGPWHESFTRAEYVRAGADVGEAADPGNFGAFVLTFRPNGRYTLVRPNQLLGTSGGTYRVNGGTVTLHCPCDTVAWHFRWSVYRGKLSLQNTAPRRSGPPGLIVKPWLRGR